MKTMETINNNSDWFDICEDTCNKYNIDFNFIYNAYKEPHRHYHTWNHIENLLNKAEEANFLSDDLIFAILFHDIIYDPTKTDNEIQSANIFMKMCGHLHNEINIDYICDAIIETKEITKTTNSISYKLHSLDTDILYTKNITDFIDYNYKIFEEYQCLDFNFYKQKRIELLEQYQVSDIYINYVKNWTPKIAIYPGSFNPFHIGHLNILKKSEQIFDKVIIGYGVNPMKEIPVVRKNKNEVINIKCLNQDTPKIPTTLKYHQVIQYNGLLTDCIKSLGYPVTVIRGLRNGSDLQYELNQYRFLQELMPDIKMVSIFCDSEYEHISSSTIRSLKNYNADKNYLV